MFTLSGLITLLVVLVILGLAWYLIEKYVPIAPPVKTIIYALIVLFVVLWFLQAVGVWHPSFPR